MATINNAAALAAAANRAAILGFNDNGGAGNFTGGNAANSMVVTLLYATVAA